MTVDQQVSAWSAEVSQREYARMDARMNRLGLWAAKAALVYLTARLLWWWVVS